MCATCGCDSDQAVPELPAPLARRRRVRIEQDLLARNDALAVANRKWFQDRGLLVLNLVSSPGAGKTTLLVETIQRLKGEWPIAVIEGDQQSRIDADRIRATGVPAIQINTGKGCHLDAHQVGHAARELNLARGGLLLVENVGNLVCPAGFDLGEAHKVLILSVPEGDDKPCKYPDLFAASDLLVISKIDLLPFVPFDLACCFERALAVNPRLDVIRLSARTGLHLDAWLHWIRLRALAGQA